MISRLASAIAVTALLGAGACSAPTQHTGKRPLATRREPDMGPDKTLEERLADRTERLGSVSERAGSAVDAKDQLIGVGSTHFFHEPDCPLLNDVPRADRVRFVSLFDALDGGYAPCSTCKPRR